MQSCENCLSSSWEAAAYCAGDDGPTLPALSCNGCGCLELDVERIDEIAARVGAPELASLRGAALRNAVYDTLAARSTRASHVSGLWDMDTDVEGIRVAS